MKAQFRVALKANAYNSNKAKKNITLKSLKVKMAITLANLVKSCFCVLVCYKEL